jgi:hypothetical protein
VEGSYESDNGTRDIIKGVEYVDFLNHYQDLTQDSGCLMAYAVSRRPLTTEARFDPSVVYVGFGVDKVAVGQVSHRLLRFSLSVSFHRRSIAWKRTESNLHIHRRVAQEALRLRCARSVCCGAPLH